MLKSNHSPYDRLTQLCELVVQATPERIAADLPALYSDANMGAETLARRIGAFLDWRKRGGFEIVSITDETDLQIDAEIRFPVTQDHWRLRLILDGTASAKIDELLMGRAPLPKLQDDLPDDRIAEHFISYIEDLGAHSLFSGAVLIGRHGKVLGSTAVGFASHEYQRVNTIDTRFNVASLTKSWTATVIIRLIEDGKLNLSTPISDIVEWSDRPLDRRIEVRHLLSHTSGLGDYFGKAFDQISKDKLRGIDNFLALADTFEPKFTPGTEWSYSNIGMMFLGKVIEAITDKSYYDAVRDLVFRPAGMSTTFFPHLDEVQQNCASGYGYRWTDEGPILMNATHAWAVRGAPDGCAFASLADIWAFSEAFRTGKLVSSEWVAEMTTAKPDLGSPDYGYGFATLPDDVVYGHSGGLIGASANVDMTRDPDGWTVIVLANDLSMRTPVIKARQLIGVKVQERDDAQTNMPRAGLTAR